jgi:uncharacterized protein YdcH (DUF465 family)
MFEYDQKIVESLLETDPEFKDLYKQHHALKEQVHKAEVGTRPVDDRTLGTMKKTKLQTKDRMAEMIRNYRQGHSLAWHEGDSCRAGWQGGQRAWFLARSVRRISVTPHRHQPQETACT